MIDQKNTVAVDNALPPSSNTGGNLLPPPKLSGFPREARQKTKIDYLSISSRFDIRIIFEHFQYIVKDLEFKNNGRGWNGYPESAALLAKGEVIGLMAWGASHGRNFFSLSGAGCKRWNDWACELLREILIDLKARITRIDLALDFYRGEVSYEDCEAALAAGEFSLKTGGRKPAVERHGSTGHYGNMGRTLEVGGKKSSKRMVCYEKGLEQFGKLPGKWLEEQTEESVAAFQFDDSFGCVGDTRVADWMRLELRYTNDDRNLDVEDFEIVVKRDKYFAGANPFNARVIGLTDGIRPPTLVTESLADVEKMKVAAKDSYGGLIKALRMLDYSDSDIVAALIGQAPSKRLEKSGLLHEVEQVRQGCPF